MVRANMRIAHNKAQLVKKGFRWALNIPQSGALFGDFPTGCRRGLDD